LEEKLIKEIASNMLFILPSLGNKLIKPTEHQVKYLISPLLLYVCLVLSIKKECTMSEMAKELGISNSQLTPIINKAAKQNLISRESNEADRRILRISLTLAGQEMLDRLGEEIAAHLGEKLALLEDEDILTLYRALNDLNKILNKLPLL